MSTETRARRGVLPYPAARPRWSWRRAVAAALEALSTLAIIAGTLTILWCAAYGGM